MLRTEQGLKCMLVALFRGKTRGEVQFPLLKWEREVSAGGRGISAVGWEIRKKFLMLESPLFHLGYIQGKESSIFKFVIYVFIYLLHENI